MSPLKSREMIFQAGLYTTEEIIKSLIWSGSSILFPAIRVARQLSKILKIIKRMVKHCYIL